jgi:transcriptional regulator with XRE-family HTH domain
MITKEQCRAARGLLDWSQSRLAEAASVGLSTIRQFEGGSRQPIANNLSAIRSALGEAGVQFLADGAVSTGPGVALRLPAREAATEAEMRASAGEVRSHAATAVDEALVGSDATAEQKAERRGALTDESEMIGQARGKGRGKLSPDK